MEFSGIIHKINEVVHVNATFKKRSFVIESSETKGERTFTELVQFEFIQDKCDLLDGFKVGDQVNIGFNLKGRKWTSPQGEDKFFNTLQAWMINLLTDKELPTPQAEIPQAAHEGPSQGVKKAAPKVEMPKFGDVPEDDEIF
jgi:hypothetical protein